MLLFAGFLKKKVVNHLHGFDFFLFYERSGILKPWLNKAYQTVSTSIVLTKSMVKQFDHFNEMNKVIVPNFYPDSFDEFEFIGHDDIAITFFSNIMKSKGILEFLEACRIIHGKEKDVRFIVGGTYMGDKYKSKKEIERLVQSFLKENPTMKVEFKGYVHSIDRMKLLNDSSIFVLPSYSEGFPLTILEAMRSGNAIITTNIDSLPEIIGLDNGILVEPRNAISLADAILRYIEDKDLLEETRLKNINDAKMKYSETKYIKSVRAIIG
ncbi:glycosyltransferase family 4 protein [Reichenbachiella sp. MALMAid0571]|uniref:glycosyltransferase family 4 protein n=1 Tax=Reichenbachiella sp. MALMAid0571 TaxID=3143939 RepID=UPI0032DF7069